MFKKFYSYNVHSQDFYSWNYVLLAIYNCQWLLNIMSYSWIEFWYLALAIKTIFWTTRLNKYHNYKINVEIWVHCKSVQDIHLSSLEGMNEHSSQRHIQSKESPLMGSICMTCTEQFTCVLNKLQLCISNNCANLCDALSVMLICS